MTVDLGLIFDRGGSETECVDRPFEIAFPLGFAERTTLPQGGF
jgi:hypothetical protein